MTDRHAGYIVVLEKEIREDDAKEGIIKAIRMIKGVLTVKPIINNSEIMIAEEKARHELGQKLWEVLYPKS